MSAANVQADQENFGKMRRVLGSKTILHSLDVKKYLSVAKMHFFY